MQHFTKFLNPSLALLMGLTAGAPAFSDSEIEEVRVVADFRGGDADTLATSLSVIDADAIDALGARHFDELIGSLPNVNFAGGTSRARFFQIRGIGERSQFASPLNPSVGYIVDNVDFSGMGSIGTLFDVSQVEVFRGPQGTRYGANALAGLIYIKTNDPTREQSLDVTATAGEYGHMSLGFVANQPLSDQAAIRLAVERHNSDGFYSNQFLGKDDVNERDETTARLKLSLNNLLGFEIMAGLTRVDSDNGYDTFSLDNDRRTRSDQPGRDVQESDSLFIEATRELAYADLVLIAAASESDLEYSYDEDWTFTGFDPIGYTSFDQYLRDKSVNSQEVRLLSNDSTRLFDDSTDWLVGLYRLDQEEALERNYTFLGGPFTSDYDFETTALFFQMDTELTPDWSLAWGARLERRETEYRNSDLVAFSPSETMWGGRLAAKYQFSPATMAYMSIARGYKAGGFNTDGTLPTDLREFDSETLVELELGMKSRLLNNRLALNGAIFYDERRDQQVKSSFVQQRADGSTEFVDFLGNAAEGTNRGIELTTSWLVSESWTIDLMAAALDAEFDRFVNEFGEDLSGRDQAQAPSYSYQLSFNWQNGPWQANLSFQGKDEFFFSDRHDLESRKQNLINAGLRYEQQRFSIHLWGRNLADKDYTVRGFGSFGNDPRNGYQTEPYVQFGEPRVIGVTTRFQFGGES